MFRFSNARSNVTEFDAIRTLVSLQDDPHQPCDTADTIAKARLVEVEQRIRSLTALKSDLQLIEGCSHARIAEGRVIGILADHGKSEHEHGSPA